jgi:16S rRNA (uracil1498-N3)-methyltransferase
MAHFYLVDPMTELVVGGFVTLDGAEGRHAATVSRIRVGEELKVGNGQGAIGVGPVTSTGKDSLTVRIDHVEVGTKQSPELVLIQALAKTDRDERAVEMATELGVDRVLPWMAERSISRWDESKAEKGRQKWQAIAREASKQSIRAFVPEVEPVSSVVGMLSFFAPTQLLVLDPTGDISLSAAVLDTAVVAMVVGPEGGITEPELAQFRAAGAQIVTMGANVLRTSTAGPAAIAVLNARLGRL